MCFNSKDNRPQSNTALEQGKSDMKDYYEVLGVSRDAQPYQILTAYNDKLAQVRAFPFAALGGRAEMQMLEPVVIFLSLADRKRPLSGSKSLS